MRTYVGLVHYPVYNKNMEKIASSITTLDIHDIARLSRTYEVKRFYVITPLIDQQRIVKAIIDHWTKGYGAKYNPDRKEAIRLVDVVESIEEAVRKIEEREKERPVIIATDAKRQKRFISFEDARKILEKKTVFILFGTAWGLHKEVLENVDFVLEPIYGRGDYRHLSVRTAAAIIIDRLIGEG